MEIKEIEGIKNKKNVYDQALHQETRWKDRLMLEKDKFWEFYEAM